MIDRSSETVSQLVGRGKDFPLHRVVQQAPVAVVTPGLRGFESFISGLFLGISLSNRLGQSKTLITQCSVTSSRMGTLGVTRDECVTCTAAGEEQRAVEATASFFVLRVILSRLPDCGRVARDTDRVALIVCARSNIRAQRWVCVVSEIPFGSVRTYSTRPQMCSSDSTLPKAGMPLKRMPFLMIQKSSRSE